MLVGGAYPVELVKVCESCLDTTVIKKNYSEKTALQIKQFLEAWPNRLKILVVVVETCTSVYGKG